MSNSNYAQVSTLLAQGKLHWQTDNISALLLTGASFDAADTTVADVGGTSVGGGPVMGRALVENKALGQPVFFSEVTADSEYQVILVQNTGPNTANVLAFIDENFDGDPITVDRDGTLVVRPVEFDPEEAPDGTVIPPQVGVWMTL